MFLELYVVCGEWKENNGGNFSACLFFKGKRIFGSDFEFCTISLLVMLKY
jgi:hypothetical protein